MGGGHRPLLGLRVGLLQTRYAPELATLIERIGGVPIVAPCLREVRNDDDEELRRGLRAVVSAPVHVFVF